MANKTAPYGNFGRSLKIFGYLFLGLGTVDVEDGFGIGGGITGILRPLITGNAGTVSKLYGLLEGAAGVYFSETDFFLSFSFLMLFFLSLHHCIE